MLNLEHQCPLAWPQEAPYYWFTLFLDLWRISANINSFQTEDRLQLSGFKFGCKTSKTTWAEVSVGQPGNGVGAISASKLVFSFFFFLLLRKTNHPSSPFPPPRALSHVYHVILHICNNTGSFVVITPFICNLHLRSTTSSPLHLPSHADVFTLKTINSPLSGLERRFNNIQKGDNQMRLTCNF